MQAWLNPLNSWDVLHAGDPLHAQLPRTPRRMAAGLSTAIEELVETIPWYSAFLLGVPALDGGNGFVALLKSVSFIISNNKNCCAHGTLCSYSCLTIKYSSLTLSGTPVCGHALRFRHFSTAAPHWRDAGSHPTTPLARTLVLQWRDHLHTFRSSFEKLLADAHY